MGKTLLLFSSIVLMCACSEQKEFFMPDVENENSMNGVVMTIPEFVVSENDATTRTQLTTTDASVNFAWKEGDEVGIYTSSTSMANFRIDQISQNTKSATFEGGGFSLTKGATYFAFYPYNSASTDKTSVEVDYSGQTQIANNDCSHLAAYDYLVAKTTAKGANEAKFDFAHLGAILRLKITLPDDGTFTELSITSPTAITTKGIVNLTDETPSVTSTQSDKKFVLKLDNITTADKNLTAILLLPPTDLSGSNLICTITNGIGDTFSGVIAGKNLQAGHVYEYLSTIQEDISYLTFNATSAQTLTMSKSVPTLQYSVNYGAWTNLGTNSVSFGGTKGRLRVRGKCPYGTAKENETQENYAKMTFGTSANVECSGDIRTLIDYENYETVDTGNARFCSLFRSCTQLTTSPELPATNLASACYYCMFFGCTSLASAPNLPATALSNSCYMNMFTDCSSLATAPELPATNLTNSCYYAMFRGCSKLTTAPELPSTVMTPWCYCDMFCYCANLTAAPELPATTLAEGCYSFMLSGCSKLTIAPALPATQLKSQCYAHMFQNCNNLTAAPDLPATTLVSYCYDYMFYGCTKLNSIAVGFTNWSNYTTNDWLRNVASIGIFKCPAALNTTTRDSSHIPDGWTIEKDYGVPVVDLGLPSGIIWAAQNVGAETGSYFHWGEIEPIKEWSENTHVGISTLTEEDDAARKIMGGKWRIPTSAEWQELIDGCNWSYDGSLSFVGKSKTNGNTITIALAGSYRSYYGDRTDDYGVLYGEYWARDAKNYGSFQRPYYTTLTRGYYIDEEDLLVFSGSIYLTVSTNSDYKGIYGLPIRAIVEN